MEKLTKQDQDFVREVAITGNQTQAVKNAYGIENDGYARKKGSVQVAKSNIAMAIEETKKTLADSIPDELVSSKHIALLNKTDELGGLDTQAVSKGIDMAYKLKGSYAPDKSINLNVEANITDSKARELADKYEQELKKIL